MTLKFNGFGRHHFLDYNPMVNNGWMTLKLVWVGWFGLFVKLLDHTFIALRPLPQIICFLFR